MPTETNQDYYARIRRNALASGSTPVGTPSAISVEGIQTPATAIQVPPPPTPIDANGISASIPTPQQIVDQTTQPTDAQNVQSDILKSIAERIGGSTSLATRQTEQGAAAGLPGFAKTITELDAQLQGLNDQATALQLAATPGGSIENQLQLAIEGRGVTEGGLAPLRAGELRKNQIQQATIAGQALTTKAALYAAQGQYTLAKDSADKAAQVQFDAQEQDIKYRQALLAAIQPQLDRDQQKQATLQQVSLQDRQNLLALQRDSYKAGQGYAVTAMTLNSNDPAAQYAAQQALKLDPNDPNYLAKVLNLVGQYQQDPIAVQQAAANLRVTLANARKVERENQPGSGGGGGEQLYSGLSSSTATAVRSKVTKFSSEPIIQNFATIQDGYNFASSISDTTQNPADDQALIYSLAKALDPGSVVREGEYATAQKYAQSWLKAYGTGVTQAILGTGFLSKEARQNIKQTIKQKYEASKTSYDNLYGSYVNNINSLTGRGDGTAFLQDYVTTTEPVDTNTIDVISPDGQTGSIPSAQLLEAFKEGYHLPDAPMSRL